MRVIKNYEPKDINMDMLYNDTSWGAIELNLNLDANQLLEYYQKIKNDFSHVYFDFYKFPERLKIEISKQYMELGYCGYYCGPISGYTLAWPVEKYEPLPPSGQANADMFPEILDPEFYEKSNVLPKYRFGYMNYLLEWLGNDSLKQCIITIHGPTAKINTHTDSSVKKLHIPLVTNEQAFFCFGKDREVKFNMKVGKAYILNTNAYHGTENNGSTDRAHIITRIDEDVIMKVVKQ
jgi:hypothetical protein